MVVDHLVGGKAASEDCVASHFNVKMLHAHQLLQFFML